MIFPYIRWTRLLRKSEDDGLDLGAPTTSVIMWSEIGGIVREHCLSHVLEYVWNLLSSEIEAYEDELQHNSEMGFMHAPW